VIGFDLLFFRSIPSMLIRECFFPWMKKRSCTLKYSNISVPTFFYHQVVRQKWVANILMSSLQYLFFWMIGFDLLFFRSIPSILIRECFFPWMKKRNCTLKYSNISVPTFFYHQMVRQKCLFGWLDSTYSSDRFHLPIYQRMFLPLNEEAKLYYE
jgi:hypothetical protein